MSDLDFVVNREACTRCGACIKDCPRHIIRFHETYPAIRKEDEAECIRCQHCLAVCPEGAISIFGLRPEDSLPLGKEPAVSGEDLRRFVRGRRTTRAYRKENVPRETIDALLADAAHAPTGGNICGLTFTVVDDRPVLESLLEKVVSRLEKAIENGVVIPEFIQQAAQAYRKGDDVIFRKAPNLMIASANEASYCGETDVVIALSYFELLAQSRGIGTTWCGFLKFVFDAQPELMPLFGLTPGQPYYVMAFGYPTVHYARTVQRDTAARIETLR